MPIVGINLNSISAKRISDKPRGEIKISSAPSIKKVTKSDVKIAGMKDILSFEFQFKTRYEPDVGDITINGELLYQPTKDAESILKDWNNNKKLSSEVALEVLNNIFRRCLIKTVSIADDLRLPPPVQFPIVKARK